MNALLPDSPEYARVLQALEADPLNLPADVAELVHRDPALAELRVQWLALDEAPMPLAPAGYFERLPGRIAGKLPGQPRRLGSRLSPLLWSAAAVALLAIGAGGFLAGRANRTPVVEASTKPETPPYAVGDSPFQEKDDLLVQADQLSPAEVQALLKRLETSTKRP
jgi:hypothetical protein